MTRKVEELASILGAEADLMEALNGVLKKKQQAIIRFQGETLLEDTHKEQLLLQSLQALESERAECSSNLAEALAFHPGGSEMRPATMTELAGALPEEDSERVSAEVGRIRNAVESILSTNDQNRVLLQHSLRFVQQTLKIITDDSRKKLIDERM